MPRLTADQLPTHGQPLWRPPSAWRDEPQLMALQPWLTHSGSLTEKLRAAVGGAFHVRVLHEGVTQLGAEDAMLLHMLPGSTARLREVQLCGDVPLVYARTLAPSKAAGWLQDLNSRPLGDRVFAEAGTQRGAIEAARLDDTQPLYRSAVKDIEHAAAILWARRSVLSLRDSRLLIYECFLGIPER
ncbi:MAG: chorismate lyase [Gammaproteobacteria bacterium]|nr:chorismate lyase [Gammaproteobacteria bacterium]